MLNRLRKGVKSLTAKVLIVLLVISFAVWGIGDIFSFRLDARVAQVGETEVSAQRFADALARQQNRISRQRGELVTFEQLRQGGVAGAVLDGLIRDAAFAEELDAFGLAAPDDAVAGEIRSEPAFQGPGGQFSRQYYELALQQQGMTAQEFEELTRTLLGQDILVEAARAGAVPPPGVAQRIAAYRNERRSVNMLTLDAEMAPDPGTPGPDELRSFYEANEDMFTEPERRWGEYLHVDPANLSEEFRPSEDEVRAAYEENKAGYTTADRRVVEQITFPERVAAETAVSNLLAGNATFESLAEQQGLSAQEVSLGEVTRDDLPDAAAALVFDADEPGILGPVELPAGFAVYRVREIREGGTAPFEEVRGEIADRLAQDALLTRAPEIANEIEELRAAGNSMREIGQKTAATHGSFDGLAQDGTLAGGGEAEGLLARQAFIDEVFTALDAEERSIVETERGGYFVVMVRRIEPSRVLALEEVRERAIAAWRDEQRIEALQERAAEITARLGEEASIWDVGEEIGAEVSSVGPFTRLGAPDSVPQPLVEKIFRAASGDGVFAPAGDGGAVVVAQVASVNMPAPAQIEEQSAELEGVLADSVGSDLSEFFGRALVARHDPQVEWGVVDEVFNRLSGGGQGGQPAY